MRVLETGELEKMELVVSATIKSAGLSPCQKFQKGATVFKTDSATGEYKILGTGFNHPVFPRECQPENCFEYCRDYTIHARQDAVQSAIEGGYDLNGASVLQFESRQEEIVTSDELDCLSCSHFLRDLGKTALKEVVLYQTPGIYIAYEVPEFHEYTERYVNTKTYPPSRQRLIDNFLRRNG